MTSLPWSNRLPTGSWIPLYVFLTIVSVLTQGASSSKCQDVVAETTQCFDSYMLHSQTLYNSPQKLCCGVDVEMLRAFCSSYTKAIRCTKRVKRSCPASAHSAIEKTLATFTQDRAGVEDLCSDDSVIEAYAMYQACFTYESEQCFTMYLEDSASIRFLSKVNTKHKESFCRNMRSTVNCVQDHVQRDCGTQAARLAVLLVRPMVKESSLCDYSIMDSEPANTDSRDSRPNRGSKTSDGNHGNHHRRHQNKNKDSRYGNGNTQGRQGGGPNNSATSLRSSLFTSILSTVIFVSVVMGAVIGGVHCRDFILFQNV